MWPVVTVPVLSSTIVSMARVDSRTCGPLIRMPSWAPRPVPTINAVGVASPRAHGQAMIKTATAAVKASTVGLPSNSHTLRVARAIRMTAGTNHVEMRSARRWTSAFPSWASSTRRAIWANCVPEPTAVARMTSRPPWLTVAPVAVKPGAASTGRDSPVSIDSSIDEVPETTTPSVAIVVPGRTTNSSPTASSSSGIVASTPSRRTTTSLAPRSMSARRAALDWCLALASR